MAETYEAQQQEQLHEEKGEGEQERRNNELHEISQQYSHIPPSPGTQALSFTDGNLGDIMAAEFGDLSIQGPPSASADSAHENGHPKTHSPDPAVSSKENGAQSMNSEPEIQALEEDRNTVAETIFDANHSQTDLVGPSSSTSTTMNEAEQHLLGFSTMGGDVLYNAVAFGDEVHSRQRILAFAAKRCANAVQRNPQDYDALYNWALVLQESADNIGANYSGTGKDQLLEEACVKYKAATDLCPTLHEAFYNWAIAISDRAKSRGRTKEAEELWKQACKKYERAVQLNRNSPQALNNWGLALQELSGIVPIKDKRMIIKTAIKKFRAAISLQFDFHRAIYNLGTVLYGLAEDTIRIGDQLSATKELTATELYSQSAIYVAAAHALKPEYPVYKSALRLVRSKLPLAYLKTGYLLVPPNCNTLAPHSDWKRVWFVLDHEAFYEVDKAGQGHFGSSPTKKTEAALSRDGTKINATQSFRVEIADICGLSSCADLSLPQGAGFSISTTSGQNYLIADTWEEVDCWVDAIRLVYTIYLRGQSDILGGIIAG